MNSKSGEEFSVVEMGGISPVASDINGSGITRFTTALPSRRKSHNLNGVFKLSVLIATTVFGYVFWVAAEALGCGFVSSFFISGAGSLLGVWAAWKFRRYFD